jgi:menaquinone-dependent protoporphyrinogen oxidase
MEGRQRALVAYATAAGSTEGVARRIAEVLTAKGIDTVCRPADAALDPAAFDAFVVGSAVHSMCWLAPALDLLSRIPPDRPLWCFSVGGLREPGSSRLVRRLADAERQRIEQRFPPGLGPRDHRLFSGVVAMAGEPLWARLFYRATGAHGGDQRNWAAIESWAAGTAAALTADRARTRTAGGAPADHWNEEAP